jgi:hypothetical protein
MSALTPNDREGLRAYLLETLSDDERAAIEARILESEEWQQALEAEREALGALDLLPEAAPPEDLAERTIARVEEEGGEEEAARSSVWRIVLTSTAVAALLAIFFGPALFQAREAARRAGAENNMKQIGLVLKMYANESPGEKYPPMTPYGDLWMFDLEKLYPKYITDLSILVDPSLRGARRIQRELHAIAAEDPVDWERMTELAARSFTYVGWTVQSAEEAEMIRTMRAELPPEELDGDLALGDDTAYRLREGIERFLITDINNPAASARGQSEIPVLLRNAPNRPSEARALYLDGHVEAISETNDGDPAHWLYNILPHLPGFD